MSTRAPSHFSPALPRWIQPWLAVLPVIPMLPACLALGGLGALRQFPAWLRALLVAYALSQLCPALFAPAPLLALAGAALRTALVFGLLGVGSWLGQAARLTLLAPGLVVVYLTALGWTFAQPGVVDIFTQRFSHPYMTANTLGLAGAAGIWLAAFGGVVRGFPSSLPAAGDQGRSWLWRWPLGAAALATVLASGSRTALLAAVVGLLAGMLVSRAYRWAWLALPLGALGAGAVAWGTQVGLNALQRFAHADSSGRDLLWNTVAGVMQAYPYSGVGSYQLGRYLQLPGTCELWSEQPCPPWLSSFSEALGSPWLIAHNVALQGWAEGGPVGFAGLFALLGAAAYTAARARQALPAAIVAGLLFGTLTDNLLLVPSPFFGELFWVAAGIAFAGQAASSVDQPAQRTARRGIAAAARSGLVGALLAAVAAFPLWLPAARAVGGSPQGASFALALLDQPLPEQQSGGGMVSVQIAGPPGEYRLRALSCAALCVPITTFALVVREQPQGPALSALVTSKPLPPFDGNLRLELYGAGAGLGVAQPLAVYPAARQTSQSRQQETKTE